MCPTSDDHWPTDYRKPYRVATAAFSRRGLARTERVRREGVRGLGQPPDFPQDVDDELLPQQKEAEDRCRDDDGIDAGAPLLRPVDVLQVKPECELIERQRRADP